MVRKQKFCLQIPGSNVMGIKIQLFFFIFLIAPEYVYVMSQYMGFEWNIFSHYVYLRNQLCGFDITNQREPYYSFMIKYFFMGYSIEFEYCITIRLTMTK